MYKAHDITCPGCGAPQSPENRICEYCGRPVEITSFSAMDGMSLPVLNKYAASYRNTLAADPENTAAGISLGMCCLKLRLYDKAVSAFEKAMESEFDNADLYFYAAIALLNGTKPFLVPRKTIDKAESYINAAIMIEPKAVYYLLWAYIRYDHHDRKSYVMHPDHAELLRSAHEAGLAGGDIPQLFGILGTPVPDAIK